MRDFVISAKGIEELTKAINAAIKEEELPYESFLRLSENGDAEPEDICKLLEWILDKELGIELDFNITQYISW